MAIAQNRKFTFSAGVLWNRERRDQPHQCTLIGPIFLDIGKQITKENISAKSRSVAICLNLNNQTRSQHDAAVAKRMLAKDDGASMIAILKDLFPEDKMRSAKHVENAMQQVEELRTIPKSISMFGLSLERQLMARARMCRKDDQIQDVINTPLFSRTVFASGTISTNPSSLLEGAVFSQLMQYAKPFGPSDVASAAKVREQVRGLIIRLKLGVLNSHNIAPSEFAIGRIFPCKATTTLLFRETGEREDFHEKGELEDIL
ncbi:hypothetical protein BJ742DRAFT_739632 [Cladochytrium replicatum]|nr:hypothetical protein BJ742DRAFT_739632 [Cladochytrium replicatum]